MILRAEIKEALYFLICYEHTSYCDQWLQLEDRFSTLDSFELFFPVIMNVKVHFPFGKLSEMEPFSMARYLEFPMV